MQRQAERERRDDEEDERKFSSRNKLIRKERITAKLKQRQVLVEAHAVTQHNGTNMFSYLLTAALVDSSDRVQKVFHDSRAIESTLAPQPPPPPTP